MPREDPGLHGNRVGSGSGPVFAGTGPQGHRSRMRERLLQGGPAALPDYEILEMLLFLGIPRRDTKPLAKGLINQFGSLAAVLGADPRWLRRTTALGMDSIAALNLVSAAATRLARAEETERPVLKSWDRLMAYLAAAPLEAAPGASLPHGRVLFLDNRNRLLADESQDGVQEPRATMRRALELHATALILLTWRPGGQPREEDVARTEQMRKAGALLAITLHDHLIAGGKAEPLSLRREGLI
ncbi:DNA repair protein radC [Roseomonas mucosa]|uniref:DNA repair protein RadC n=2 Tax=Roseomonadaceae TaxID=3385906 RepID=A0A1S8CZA0_9PROT|nr:MULTISPECIES: JAB domain-containing protein [Roseomonas]AWV22166.1 DNA repair protein radC [Roseomonas mucosa]MDU7522520.1 JAB domain-containing protein [Roseomonas mucosa]ONH81376.1 hypothetical protein APZ41_020185 [Roseomonas mucosa]QDD94279.1 DNA repair protein radC [Roseomonas mucosa]QDD99386.1 DNA repair protein radC [Roseomonas mucosa]